MMLVKEANNWLIKRHLVLRRDKDSGPTLKDRFTRSDRLAMRVIILFLFLFNCVGCVFHVEEAPAYCGYDETPYYNSPAVCYSDGCCTWLFEEFYSECADTWCYDEYMCGWQLQEYSCYPI
jgi:hypothetical protein